MFLTRMCPMIAAAADHTNCANTRLGSFMLIFNDTMLPCVEHTRCNKIQSWVFTDRYWIWLLVFYFYFLLVLYLTIERGLWGFNPKLHPTIIC